MNLGGAQAEDETEFALGKARLVRVRDNRWVEQGRGFERVFPGEERAEKELADRGERHALRKVPGVLAER
jgi:hypothetical protein